MPAHARCVWPETPKTSANVARSGGSSHLEFDGDSLPGAWRSECASNAHSNAADEPPNYAPRPGSGESNECCEPLREIRVPQDAPRALDLRSDLNKARKMLRRMAADLQKWQAQACFTVNKSQGGDPNLLLLREVRSRATLVALHGMAIVQSCAGTVDTSSLPYVHIAAFRPETVCEHDWVADSVVPAIARVYLPRPFLRFGLGGVWVIGTTCHYLVLFDVAEPGSVQEVLACVGATLMFPSIVCIGASLNAKTVWRLLRNFETLYILAFVLCMTCLQILLFHAHPAKIGCTILGMQGWMMTGFMDAYAEAGRVANSRVFFTLDILAMTLLLSMIALDLGKFSDYTFAVRSFSSSAASAVCSTIMTLLVFGGKNFILSFLYPGSLVTLFSDICCIRLDADVLALMKAAYALLGVANGKYKTNKTVAMQLKKHSKSIAAAESGRIRDSLAHLFEPRPDLNKARKVIRVAPAPSEDLPRT